MNEGETLYLLSMSNCGLRPHLWFLTSIWIPSGQWSEQTVKYHTEWHSSKKVSSVNMANVWKGIKLDSRCPVGRLQMTIWLYSDAWVEINLISSLSIKGISFPFTNTVLRHNWLVRLYTLSCLYVYTRLALLVFHVVTSLAQSLHNIDWNCRKAGRVYLVWPK